MARAGWLAGVGLGIGAGRSMPGGLLDAADWTGAALLSALGNGVRALWEEPARSFRRPIGRRWRRTRRM
jgi:hypothetical protein